MEKNLQKINSSTKKIVVYTVIFNDYDFLKPHPIKYDNIDYICFTNNKNLKSNFWTVKYIKKKMIDL